MKNLTLYPSDVEDKTAISKWTLHHSRLNVTIHANDTLDIHCTCIWGDDRELGTINFPKALEDDEDKYLEAMRKQGFTITINKTGVN